MIWSTGTRAVAVGTLAAAVVLAGCSSSKAHPSVASSSSTAPAAAAASSSADAGVSAAPSGSPAQLKGDPAMIVLTKQSLAALAKVKSVHLLGSVSDTGDSLTLDLKFANGTGSVGSIGFGGGTFKFLAINKTVYLQGDAKAFSGMGADLPPAALAALAGKWLNVGSTDGSGANSFGDFGAFADLSQFASQFASDGGTLSAAGTKTINGKAAIGILDTAADPTNSSTLYVAADGDHLPLEVVPAAPGGSAAPASEKIDFLDYDAPVSITAPTDSISLAQLAQLVGPATSPSS